MSAHWGTCMHAWVLVSILPKWFSVAHCLNRLTKKSQKLWSTLFCLSLTIFTCAAVCSHVENLSQFVTAQFPASGNLPYLDLIEILKFQETTTAQACSQHSEHRRFKKWNSRLNKVSFAVLWCFYLYSDKLINISPEFRTDKMFLKITILDISIISSVVMFRSSILN